MEAKKTKKAAIENQRGSWLLMGAVVALAFMFVSFEWTQHDIKVAAMSSRDESIFVSELPPITFPEEKPVPPPPPIPTTITEQLTIVDNDADIVDEVTTVPEDAIVPNVVWVPPVEEKEVVEDEICVFAEKMPQFPGGEAAMMKFLSSHIKYPTISLETGSQGKVIVQFVVDRDGAITNPVVLRGADPYLDKEAIRVVSSMPRWIPGEQNGKKVRVKYTVPVSFRLQ